jgi:hypothetical protein
MAEEPNVVIPTTSGPAIYRICVQGRLSPARAKRFDGLNVTEVTGQTGEAATVLVGRLMDQADLAGVLGALFDLHVTVVSVECLSDG